MKFSGVLVVLLWGGLAGSAAVFVSQVDANDELVLYPTLASPTTNGPGWSIPVHGSVYEVEKRGITLTTLRGVLGLKGVKMTKAELALLKERARLFLADSEGGRRVVVQVGDRVIDLGETAANGHFDAQLELEPLPSATGVTVPRLLEFTAVLKAGDSRQVHGQAVLLPEQGLSLISDVDDTIKVSEVNDHKALLRRTFLQPFEAVPGIAGVYRSWASNGVAFHYVSASPWQLYLPLSDFAGTNGFPRGSWHMKKWRLKDRSFVSLFEDPERYKVETIAPLLERFPQRRFILVGDSGERDPEAYATLARLFPAQVQAIFIRNVTGQGKDARRYQTNFTGLPIGLWQVFNDPQELTLPGTRRGLD